MQVGRRVSQWAFMAYILADRWTTAIGSIVSLRSTNSEKSSVQLNAQDRMGLLSDLKLSPTCVAWLWRGFTWLPCNNVANERLSSTQLCIDIPVRVQPYEI